MASYPSYPYAHRGNGTLSPAESTFSQAHAFSSFPVTPFTPYTPALLTPAILSSNNPSFIAWRRIKSGLYRMRFDRSFAVPRSCFEWESLEMKAGQARNRVIVRRIVNNNKEQAVLQNLGVRFKPKLLNGDFDQLLSDGRGAVLGQPTIWQPYHGSCVLQSPWPSYTELKHEGDERHTSQMDRFLPFPKYVVNDPRYEPGKKELKVQWPLDETIPCPWAPRYFNTLNEQTNFPWWNTINDPEESDPKENLKAVWHHVERMDELLEADDDY